MMVSDRQKQTFCIITTMVGISLVIGFGIGYVVFH